TGSAAEPARARPLGVGDRATIGPNSPTARTAPAAPAAVTTDPNRP
ncbi:hypothetical protein GT352_20945, partial [Streptomyces sp. SID1046]|nr:hypothetical protein [Streptomyces sp. SID1046]